VGPVIAVRNVGHFLGEGAVRQQVLFNVSIEVHAGEIVILTGPSGSGKSTLLTLMGALRSTQQGDLRVLGQELNGAREAQLVAVRARIGYIFQSYNLIESLNAWENVAIALSLHAGLSPVERERRSLDILAMVGLGDRTAHYPTQLSGGQQQRVAVARALAGHPAIVLADEPTASLDKKSGREVAEQLLHIAKRQGCAVVLVTHDNRILDVADRIVTMEDGRITPVREQ
jgi:putative ABC transport system ATP-binding protein